MNGYGGGRFAPGENLSRAEFVQILQNLKGNPVVNSNGWHSRGSGQMGCRAHRERIYLKPDDNR